MRLRLKVFAMLILSVMIILPSCKIHKKEEKEAKSGQIGSETVQSPYNSLKLIGCADIAFDFVQSKPEFTNQKITNMTYQLMRPDSWKKISDYEKTNQGMSLQFNKSTDKVDYCYEIYADGQIFYHSNIPGVTAKRASNGEYVNGDYAFYQAPSNIYKDLVNYLGPLAK